MKKRDTVGKIYLDATKKNENYNAIDMQQEMQSNYDKELYECISNAKLLYNEDFYITVITKKEPLIPNTYRNYFIPRLSCPTPDYDQTVYRYHYKKDSIEFLWVVPSKHTCLFIKENVLTLPEEQKELIKFVFDFADGTLFKLAKKLNKEEQFSPFIDKGS